MEWLCVLKRRFKMFSKKKKEEPKIEKKKVELDKKEYNTKNNVPPKPMD
jgi:hypothetical protein